MWDFTIKIKRDILYPTDLQGAKVCCYFKEGYEVTKYVV